MISKISELFILSKKTANTWMEEEDEDEKGGGVFEQDGSGSISYS